MRSSSKSIAGPAVVGLCALVLALWPTEAAQAGLMLPAEMDGGSVSASPFANNAGSAPVKHARNADQDTDYKLAFHSLFSQQSGTGASPTGVTVAGVGTAAAIDLPPRAVSPDDALVSLCFEFANSLLPDSPVFDLLRPPITVICAG